MKITDADRVLLNPEYIKELEEQEQQNEDSQAQQQLNDYMDELESDPLNKIDHPIAGYIKDYFEHPENSQIYRDEVIFKTESEKGVPKEDEPPEKGFSIFIPIFSTKF